nr:response regulator transcription factor [Stackebrandtia albiflava]
MLVDDSVLLREGLARLLADEGHEIVASLGDTEGLPDRVAAVRPDVVVLDVRMPPTHTDEGLRAATAIRERLPRQPVMVLSQYVERRLAGELLGDDASGVGYLLKDRVMQVDDFLSALHRVAEGGSALDPEVVRRLLDRRADPLARLSGREREVLALMAEGHTNAGIAACLHVSRSAVEKHVASVFGKLGLSQVDGYSRRVLAVLRHLAAADSSTME